MIETIINKLLFFVLVCRSKGLIFYLKILPEVQGYRGLSIALILDHGNNNFHPLSPPPHLLPRK
jgi:hypothetical protein